jgi:uncharacterized protein (DUF983 family)
LTLAEKTPRRPDDRMWPLFRNAVRLRCPVCKNARVFPALMKMADRCPACDTQLQREAGYFLGSIYFNYGVTCLLAAAIYFGLLFAFGVHPTLVLWIALAFALLFPFWFWRYARSLWLMLDQYLDPRRPPAR